MRMGRDVGTDEETPIILSEKEINEKVKKEKEKEEENEKNEKEKEKE